VVKVVGRDPKQVKRVTCRDCAAILEYTESEVKVARYSCMGDPSGHKYVDCPNCSDGGDARIPGTSW
jgi:RNase P subunit RPR2